MEIQRQDGNLAHRGETLYQNDFIANWVMAPPRDTPFDLP
jgi:hypothetical protein